MPSWVVMSAVSVFPNADVDVEYRASVQKFSRVEQSGRLESAHDRV